MTIDIFQSFDALEEVHDGRIGAPDDAVGDLLHSLGNHLIATRARTAEALAWKVRRLARALQNDWHESEVRVIVSSIGTDLAAMAA